MNPRKGRFDYASQPVQPAEPEKPVETPKPAVPTTRKRTAKPRQQAEQAEQAETGVKAVTEEAAVLTEQSELEVVRGLAKPGMETQSALLAELSTEAFTLSLGDPNNMALPPQRRGRPDIAGEGRMSIPREQLNVRIRPELKRAAAAVGALNGMTMGDVVEAALLEYVAKHR